MFVPGRPFQPSQMFVGKAGIKIINVFHSFHVVQVNKLECLSLADLSSPVRCLWVAFLRLALVLNLTTSFYSFLMLSANKPECLSLAIFNGLV